MARATAQAGSAGQSSSSAPNVDLDTTATYTQLGMQLMQFLVKGKENIPPANEDAKMKVVKLNIRRNTRSRSQSEDEELH